MPTADDATRPSKTGASPSFSDGTVYPAADFNNEAAEIFAKHNQGMGTLYTHASRHAAGGADPVTLSAIGAGAEDFGFYVGGV